MDGVRAVRRFGLLLLAVLGSMPPSAALACVRGPNYVDQERAYYNAVTSVYVAVAQNFTPEDPRYPSDNFTVQLRPAEPVWGGKPPRSPVVLEFTAGACDDWFLWDGDDSEPLDGKRYFVFVAPPANNDLTQLHIMPAGNLPASDAMIMLGRLQESGGAPPWPNGQYNDPDPDSSSSAPPPFWARRFSWPWIAGASGSFFILGLILGRAIPPRRDRQRKKS